MWLPVVVPYVFEPHSNMYQNRSARAMCQMIPFDQRVCRAMNETVASLNFLQISQGFLNDPPYAEDGQKFMLNRSLFDLVRVNHCLELTDPKLLGWYLSLPVEDRTLIQQEGGLLQFIQRHPALEVVRNFVYLKHQFRGNHKLQQPHPTTMSSNHNKSRYPFYGMSHCQNCGRSFQFGTKKKCCHCGVRILISEEEVYMSENEKDLELLPSNVREELKVITAENEISHQRYSSPAEGTYSAQAQCLSQMWEEVEQREDVEHFKDPTAQANFSLDMELDMQSQAQRINPIQNDQGQLYAELEDEANYYDMNQETLSEYHSFSRTSLNRTEWSDGSQNMEADYNDSIMATKGSTELSDEPLETTMANAANSTDSFSCPSNSFEPANDSGDSLEDLQNEKNSRYEQQIDENLGEINVGSSLKYTSSVPCGASCASFFVNQIVDACGDFRACFTSTRATQVCQISQMKARKSVATDTDSLPVSNKEDAQTMQMSASDKSTITEVYMADLDILTEEFIKLKEMEKELKQLKNRKSRPSPGGDQCGKVAGCDCAQQVRRAELRLLALQFVMCQQHCWRRYFTSPLGESTHQGTDTLPDINCLAETLNTLERDYHEMRRQILAGTPLDDLKPLSVDSQKITTGTYYSPASLLEVHLGSFDGLGSATANSHTSDDKAKGMSAPVCQNTEATPDKPKGESSNRGRVAVLPNKQPGTSSVIKDPNTSEAWFDAEEELESPNQDDMMEKKKEGRESMNHKTEQKGTDEYESDQRSLLCVTCLPRNVTEQEVLLRFKKYNATSVHISTFSNNIRAAIVYLKSPSDARAAVKDLNGCTIQGHSVHVQQLCGPASTHPKGPRCSVDRLTMICDSPTASGTCMPQHYATMGSFKTIMARLSERHPNIGRQKIVDALLELRAKKQGFLSGLSLRSIVDMTSELLTQGSTSKCV